MIWLMMSFRGRRKPVMGVMGCLGNVFLQKRALLGELTGYTLEIQIQSFVLPLSSKDRVGIGLMQSIEKMALCTVNLLK